jgi:HSP20 family protein
MVKKDDHLLVRADLPGMTKDAVEVTLDNGELVLSGKRKEETEDTEDNYYRCERHYGSFYRRLPLPFEVDAKMIKANFKEGVLEVKVPMPPEVVQKAQKISIH